MKDHKVLILWFLWYNKYTENLEHKEEIIDLPENEKKCNICGTELVCIGKENLRSELNIVPAQIFVIEYCRYVYKCPEYETQTDEANIIKPEAPVPVMKKSMASPATVAYTIQEKYQNGVTLFRQEQYWKSNGVELNSNTLANWIIRSSLWLRVFDIPFSGGYPKLGENPPEEKLAGFLPWSRELPSYCKKV